jgi:hypothetical protein
VSVVVETVAHVQLAVVVRENQKDGYKWFRIISLISIFILHLSLKINYTLFLRSLIFTCACGCPACKAFV